MKKSLSSLIIILVVIGAGVFISKKNNNSPSDTPETVPATSDIMTPHSIALKNGTSFDLQAPENFTISPAVEGLQRIRFMAWSPDERLFLTDMYDLSDNTKGKIYILSDFNQETKRFDSIITYLSDLRNPNSVAFYKDSSGIQWLYLALTDKLVRYKYTAGETAPTSISETVATFPAYGLSYKYGDWHLTRTIAIHNDKIYVSVGSSCNSCEEKEVVRASILEMDPDGSNMRLFAKGLRNSVGIKWVGDDLYATSMGVDHLGDTVPDEGFYKIQDGTDYGWPYCYVNGNGILDDTTIAWKNKQTNCALVPVPDAEFPAHAAPLGLEYFNSSFLVALHGASKLNIGSGYKIVQINEDNIVTDLISGFLKNGERFGRPVDILKYDNSSFFFSDDFTGTLYFVAVKK